MSPGMAILFLLPLVFVAVPAGAQSAPANVIINEIDINPPDGSERASGWAELYNASDLPADVGGWEVKSVSTGVAVTIPDGTLIAPGGFLLLAHTSAWLGALDEAVEVRDRNGVVIDATPPLSDLHNDSASWQRFPGDVWGLAASTAELENGTAPKKADILISADKAEYVLGEDVTLAGHVSTQIFADTKPFYPEPIILTVFGPDYHKTELFYPDLNNNFETTVKLRQVLGTGTGSYVAFVSYSGSTDKAVFAVGNTVDVVEESETGEIVLSTDKPTYLPGQTVKITGHASKLIPLETLKLQVTDPLGGIVTSGNLFPTNGTFSTTVFMNRISPAYGTYSVTGTYSEQSFTTQFDLVADVKEDVALSLWTDRQVYGLGDDVVITGRLNAQWAASLDLEVLQTKNLALGAGGAAGGGTVLKVLDAVRPDGDGRFEYVFSIPAGNVGLGDYTVKVSQNVGSTVKSFVVAEDPEAHVVSDELLAIFAEQSYDLGDKMVIGGKIADSALGTGTEPFLVRLAIADSSNSQTDIKFTAIPDPSGRFSFEVPVSRAVYAPGSYTLNVTFMDLSTSVQVQLVDTIVSVGSFAALDKQIYGLGETVRLTGVLPLTADSAVNIMLTKPDGKIINSGTRADNQKFSWTWDAPASASHASIKDADDRSIIGSNLGIYKIQLSSGPFSKVLLFKLSLDPESDTAPGQLFVSTGKPMYSVGEKLTVSGSVITRDRGTENQLTPERVHISVISGKFPYPVIYESFVYPDNGGEFKSTFDLPTALFAGGTYKIEASYFGDSAESTFDVANDLLFGTEGDADILLTIDRTQFYPGQSMTVVGQLNKMIYLDKFDISVIKRTENATVCGSFICGTHFETASAVPSQSGSFTYTYDIGDAASSVGIYEVVVDSDFVTKSVTFDVLPRPDTGSAESGTDTYTVIEKVNRIPDREIHIRTATIDLGEDGVMHPRVLSGSMITPSTSDLPDVNLMVSAESGTCVIGPGPECLVQGSTRGPGKIYDVVEVGGILYDVRYSGPDVRLEKFDIKPSDPLGFIPATDWDIQVLKDQQVSRFYYKINYKVIS